MQLRICAALLTAILLIVLRPLLLSAVYNRHGLFKKTCAQSADKILSRLGWSPEQLDSAMLHHCFSTFIGFQ